MSKISYKFRSLLHDVIFDYAPDFIKKKLMSCEEMTKIMAMEQTLSTKKKLWYKAHNYICLCCDNCEGQFKLINLKSKDLVSTDLTNAQKERIAHSKNDVLASILNK